MFFYILTIVAITGAVYAEYSYIHSAKTPAHQTTADVNSKDPHAKHPFVDV